MKKMNLVVSHMFRERHCVADRLAMQICSLQSHNWWMGILDSLAQLAHIDPDYRFSFP